MFQTANREGLSPEPECFAIIAPQISLENWLEQWSSLGMLVVIKLKLAIHWATGETHNKHVV
jgi:hypothetical protein